MDRGEIVGGPSRECCNEGEGCEEGGTASAPAGVPAGEDHHHVDGPHQHGKKNLGIEEIDVADARGRNRDDRTRDEAERHERETEQQRAISDLIDYFKCWQERYETSWLLGFQT